MKRIKNTGWRFIVGGTLLLAIAGCNLTNAREAPPPTPDLPQAEILAPENNRQIFEGTDFDIDIVGRDTVQGISRIELYVDEVFINSASPEGEGVAPVFRVQMNWLAQGLGRHTIEAVAYRPDGTRGDVALITIEVITRE